MSQMINNFIWTQYLELGESCNHGWECVVPSDVGATCDNQICRCNKGYQMNPSKTDCIGKELTLNYSLFNKTWMTKNKLWI